MRELRTDVTLTPEVLTNLPLYSVDIQKILPHRLPFLLIDRVVDLERKKRIVAIKNVTVNEPFFTGHFPGNPIMPGVLIVEAIAQTGATLLMTEIPDRASMLTVFTGIERAKFRRQVIPGDQLRLEVNVIVWRRTAVKMEGKVTVDGNEAAARVAYQTSEVIAIYPITPASDRSPNTTSTRSSAAYRCRACSSIGSEKSDSVNCAPGNTSSSAPPVTPVPQPISTMRFGAGVITRM